MASLSFALLLVTPLWSFPPQDDKVTEKVRFAAPDEVQITGDLYLASEDPETPFLVLFHQARSSRGEYRQIAPKLRALGYNCLAVDQRSGDKMAGIRNATKVSAGRKFAKPSNFVEAEPDLVAALEFAREKYAKGKLVAWGSSYSASLALRLAGTRPELMDGVLAFAPGEYFESLGESATWIEEAAGSIRCPVFITSARAEEEDWRAMFQAIPSEDKVAFLPQGKGRHGSRALLAETEGHEEYWAAVQGFLETYFPAAEPAGEGD